MKFQIRFVFKFSFFLTYLLLLQSVVHFILDRLLEGEAHFRWACVTKCVEAEMQKASFGTVIFWSLYYCKHNEIRAWTGMKKVRTERKQLSNYARKISIIGKWFLHSKNSHSILLLNSLYLPLQHYCICLSYKTVTLQGKGCILLIQFCVFFKSLVIKHYSKYWDKAIIKNRKSQPSRTLNIFPFIFHGA